MSEFVPVVFKRDLETLDDAEIVEGYMAGLKGELEPGSDRSRSYWHGWRNGHNDRNHTVDESQMLLAREVYGPTRRMQMN